MTIQELEQMLLRKMDGEFTSLTISFNEHACNYVTVKQWVEEYPTQDHFKHAWVSEEEKQKAIETNSLWEIQIYPNTPVGSYNYAASSLMALIEHIIKDGEGL